MRSFTEAWWAAGCRWGVCWEQLRAFGLHSSSRSTLQVGSRAPASVNLQIWDLAIRWCTVSVSLFHSFCVIPLFLPPCPRARTTSHYTPHSTYIPPKPDSHLTHTKRPDWCGALAGMISKSSLVIQMCSLKLLASLLPPPLGSHHHLTRPGFISHLSDHFTLPKPPCNLLSLAEASISFLCSYSRASLI